jgi:hypothetical protein
MMASSLLSLMVKGTHFSQPFESYVFARWTQGSHEMRTSGKAAWRMIDLWAFVRECFQSGSLSPRFDPHRKALLDFVPFLTSRIMQSQINFHNAHYLMWFLMQLRIGMPL